MRLHDTPGSRVTDIFDPFMLGKLKLANRIVVAPMTRSRASRAGVPSDMAPTYYSQRATSALIITEASQVSAQGVGYMRTPGNYTDEMVEGWSAVTEAVHEAGGRIFLQLWHVGRTSHPDFHGGDLPVAPSAIGYDGEVFTREGRKSIVTPRALETSEIRSIVDDFARGARNAMRAGFDGVEIHGANGYLLDQFLRDGSNRRDDRYGGSIENRARFPLEVTDAVVAEIGADKVGYRINPLNEPHFGMSDSNPKAIYGYLVPELAERDLAYLHVLEPLPAGDKPTTETDALPSERLTPLFRKLFPRALIVNGGYTKQSANAALGIGRSRSDRLRQSLPRQSGLAKTAPHPRAPQYPDPETFYQGEQKGYIDYPTLATNYDLFNKLERTG